MAKDKQSDVQDTGKNAPAADDTPPKPSVNIWQWCQISGKAPHRTRAFVCSQPENERDATKPAEQWQAAFDAFNNTPIT